MRRLVLVIAAVLAFSGGAMIAASTGSTVGYVGCSNTYMTVNGAHLDGGVNMWPANGNYGGGTVQAWYRDITRQSRYWPAFRQMLAAQPTQTIWFQACAKVNENPNLNYQAALGVLAQLQREIPGVTVYISPINGYSGIVCSALGPNGNAAMVSLANQLVSEGDGPAGPYPGDLTASQVQADGCHPNDAGQRFLGQSLLGVFG